MECATSALTAFITEGEESLARKGVNEILSAVLLRLTSGNLIIWEEVCLGIILSGCKKLLKDTLPPLLYTLPLEKEGR